jgi:hypothetical protein
MLSLSEFKKKLHDEVPSGKNYIIKNIKGKDFVVVKNLEGQNKETLVTFSKTSFFFMLSLSEFIILSLAIPYRPFIANSNICCGLISKPISLCISLNNLFLIGLGIR